MPLGITFGKNNGSSKGSNYGFKTEIPLMVPWTFENEIEFPSKGG